VVQSPYSKRLIEVDLPIARISAHARREKSIRHGHISTLHIWWARRPLAACRAVICAALWPDPADPNCPQAFRDAAISALSTFARKATPQFSMNGTGGSKTSDESRVIDEGLSPESRARWEAIAKGTLTLDAAKSDDMPTLRMALLDFIADFANWDNSIVPAYLETSRALTQAAHEVLGGEPGTRPLVVDPFAGGGSIPLEALRVGADAFASDLNPIPVLLNKVVLEYIPKYGKRLADEVRRWGEWIKQEAEKELAEFYPKDPDGATPIAYLWARTVRCEGPACGAEIPLVRSSLLADKGKNSVRLKLVTDQQKKAINFELETGARVASRVDAILRRSSATCPICGFTTPAANVRNQFKGRQGGAADARLLAVVTTTPDRTGRTFRLPMEHDELAVEKARIRLTSLRNTSPQDVPDEELPYLRSIFNIHLLDVTKWSSLFTPRQMVSLICLIQAVRGMSHKLANSISDREMRDAIVTCVALAVDRVAAQFSSLSWWQPKGEFVAGTFGRQALGIIWDFAEIRPVNGASGDLDGAIDWVTRVIESIGNSFGSGATVEKASATRHPLPDDSAAAVVTDPPYYDAVPYADLSDFFYVLLKRMLQGVHPSLFADSLTPKEGEIVQLAERNPKYAFKTKEYFEQGMRDALMESRRTTVPHGLGVIVFAHKTTEGWEVMLSSIISAGWVITASWPIDTERAVRMRANNSAALASSVHLVCRPRENADGSVIELVGEWRDILGELPQRIHEWMPRLAAEGVVGADAIFACLGPALEIYSRYSRVEKSSGEQATLREYLEHVWAAVSTEALSLIFKDANAAGLEPDARLTAMWLWTIGGGGAGTNDKSSTDADDEETDSEDNGEDEAPRKASKSAGGFTLEFDAARKIAQGLGVDLEQSKTLVEVKGDKARLLPVSERVEHLFGRHEAVSGARPKKKRTQKSLFDQKELEGEVGLGWGNIQGAAPGSTVLDRVHQSMVLFAANRGELLKRFLVEDGVGKDARFWKLADNLNKLYPAGTDERRWVEGVLARKKGLGL
jgi:putative DNA methylase